MSTAMLDDGPILSSMVYEWKLMARNVTITAVALAAMNSVNVKVLSFIRLPCLFFGIYKTCAIYESPRVRQSVSKLGQIGANLTIVSTVFALSIIMLSMKADMNDYQKDRFGKLFQAIMEFFNALSTLSVCRAIYLTLDTYVYPDALNEFSNWEQVRDGDGPQ